MGDEALVLFIHWLLIGFWGVGVALKNICQFAVKVKGWGLSRKNDCRSPTYVTREISPEDGVWINITIGVSQSAPKFSSQGTDQGVSHFKGCLNRQILPVHWPFRLKTLSVYTSDFRRFSGDEKLFENARGGVFKWKRAWTRLKKSHNA